MAIKSRSADCARPLSLLFGRRLDRRRWRRCRKREVGIEDVAVQLPRTICLLAPDLDVLTSVGDFLTARSRSDKRIPSTCPCRVALAFNFDRFKHHRFDGRERLAPLPDLFPAVQDWRIRNEELS